MIRLTVRCCDRGFTSMELRSDLISSSVLFTRSDWDIIALAQSAIRMFNIYQWLNIYSENKSILPTNVGIWYRSHWVHHNSNKVTSIINTESTQPLREQVPTNTQPNNQLPDTTKSFRHFCEGKTPTKPLWCSHQLSSHIQHETNGVPPGWSDRLHKHL